MQGGSCEDLWSGVSKLLSDMWMDAVLVLASASPQIWQRGQRETKPCSAHARTHPNQNHPAVPQTLILSLISKRMAHLDTELVGLGSNKTQKINFSQQIKV